MTAEERRAWVARRDPEKARAADRARYERDKPKRRAQWTARNAVRDGRLLRGACEVCGAEKVHAHHDDYSKPLEVRWLCPKHHAANHAS